MMTVQTCLQTRVLFLPNVPTVFFWWTDGGPKFQLLAKYASIFRDDTWRPIILEKDPITPTAVGEVKHETPIR